MSIEGWLLFGLVAGVVTGVISGVVTYLLIK